MSHVNKQLVLVHGWGMNASVWSEILPFLEQHFTVAVFEIPGHGLKHQLQLESLPEVVEELAAQINDEAFLLGWSLGGLICQQLAASFPERVRALLLVATTPCFRASSDWPAAMSPEVMLRFHDSLVQDYEKTVRQFIALQFQGEQNAREHIRQFQDMVMTRPASQQALKQGMDILMETDLRDADVAAPCHWLLGSYDRLVPVEVAEYLQGKEEDSVTIIPKAGHAPFISHPDAFVQYVLESTRA